MRAREVSHFKLICSLAVKLRFHERYLLSEEDFRKLMARSVLSTQAEEEDLHGTNPLKICNWECSHLFGLVLGELYHIGIVDVTDKDLRYAERRATVPELGSLEDAYDAIRSSETC